MKQKNELNEASYNYMSFLNFILDLILFFVISRCIKKAKFSIKETLFF